jgi:branched-chain amino acid aminotransferase
MRGELLVYIDGKYVRESEARVSVFDHSFLYGDGVFEGVRVEDGGIFALEEHVERLYKSAACIRLQVPMQKEEMKIILKDVVRKNDLRDGYIRPLLSRGVGPMGIARMRELRSPSFLVIPQFRPEASRELWGKGMHAKVVSVRRNHPQCLDPRIKANQYLNNILALYEAWDAGAEVAIMLDLEGYVSECNAENIFIVGDETLYTPGVTNTLDGITRNKVLTIAKEQGIPALEKNLTTYDLYTADEVFATGSLSLVEPLTRIDGRPIGTGEPGPMTKTVAELLREKLRKESAKVFV